MSNFKSFLKEQASIEKSRRERSSHLVESWKPTKLLEGLDKNDQHELAQLLQNQTNRLIKEATRTSTSAGSEEWSGIALPMVRKVFTEQLAKQLVHVQSMDRPNGLVFYLDFELDDNRPAGDPFYSASESVYGVTDTENDPSGGFYGNDKYSYSQNFFSTTVVPANYDVSAPADVTSERVSYDPRLEQKVADEDLVEVTVDFNASNLDADVLALESFTVSSDEAGEVTAVYRRHTEYNESQNELSFIIEGAGSNAGSWAGDLTVNYVKQPKAFDRGDFEMKDGFDGSEIPEINLKVNSKEIVAKTRKLKTVMTPEIIQDLGAYHNMDAQKEMADLVSKYVAQETDTEILRMLSRASRNITRYWSAMPGRYLNSKTGEIDNDQPTYTLGPVDWYKTLGIRIRDVSNEIHRRTLRGGANWIVCSSKVATILESFNTFRTVQDNDTTYGMGTEKVGTLDGRITIYKNPYYPDEEMLVGFKGSSFLESGAAYGVYVPFQLTPPLTDPKTFDVVQGMQTRDVKTVLRSEFYARIIVRDTDKV